MIVVQCEFDGAVTEEDVGAALLKMFGPTATETSRPDDGACAPSEEQRLAALYAQVTADRQTILDFVLSVVVVRYDFDQFVNYCRGESVRLAIVSTGLDLYIRPTLDLLDFEALETHTGKATFVGNGVSVEYVGPGGVSVDRGFKSAFVRNFREQGHTVVYVGAGASCLDAAREADFAIARDALAEAMEAEGLPHYTFDTFGDVARSIIEIGKMPRA